MRITKYTHACVRLERDGRSLLIDPGIWTEPEAFDGVDALLVTHEHSDHVDVAAVRGLGVPVYAPAGAAIDGIGFTPLTSGEEVEIVGFRVRPVGSRHAVIYGGKPDCANLGYVVDGAVYHPGDALYVPEQPVEVALVPVHGSWMKIGEAIDFVRAVGPAQAYPIHDAQLGERGLPGVDAWLGHECGTAYRRLAPGESATVG